MIKQNKVIRDAMSRNILKEAQWKYESVKTQYLSLPVLHRILVLLIILLATILFYYLFEGSYSGNAPEGHRLVLIRSVLSKNGEEVPYE